MTEIQRLLSETIDDLNVREKRDNRPRFSISFIRKHPGLFIAMYAAWFATLAVMLQS
ncbi:TPA: YlaC family protein, partial [Salmonella enterica subsp. enterica serovar Give]